MVSTDFMKVDELMQVGRRMPSCCFYERRTISRRFAACAFWQDAGVQQMQSCGANLCHCGIIARASWRSFDVEHTFAIGCRFCQLNKKEDGQCIRICGPEKSLTADEPIGKRIVVDPLRSVTEFNDLVVVA